MNTTNHSQVFPDDEAINLAKVSASELSRLLAEKPETDRARFQLDGHDLILPMQALALLRDLLAEMAQGNAVTVVPTHAELTTQEAASILNVSRPHLIKLLEDSQIPFTEVRKHRRIRYQALLAYKQLHDKESEDALDELVAQVQEHDMGY